MYFIQVGAPSIWSNDYWSGVFQNAIGCAIGSFAAIIISLYIYRKQTIDNNKAIEKSVELREKNQLNAFALMLGNAIDPIAMQSENISNFIIELAKYPTTFPLLKMHTWGNLKRIIDTITVEQTGLAYMKHFKSDDSAKEFTSILNTVDYLYYELSGLPTFLERSSLNHTDRQIEFREVFDSIDFIVRKYVSSVPPVDEVAIRLAQIKSLYLLNRADPSDLRYSYEHYLIPIIELMKELINSNIENSVIESLTFETSKGIEFYKTIEIGYEQFTREMKILQKEIDKNLVRLREDTSKIIQSEFNKN